MQFSRNGAMGQRSRTRGTGPVVHYEASAEERYAAKLVSSIAVRQSVLEHCKTLVASGLAGWVPLETGEIALQLSSGEVFRLGPRAVTRIA